MIVVDASVLIAHLDRDDHHHEAAEERLLAAAVEGLAASSVTLAEVLVGPARAGRLDLARDLIDALGVREVPFGARPAERLAAIRAETGLKLPDCCVLLAVQDTSAVGMTSFNRGLAAGAARLRIDAFE